VTYDNWHGKGCRCRSVREGPAGRAARRLMVDDDSNVPPTRRHAEPGTKTRFQSGEPPADKCSRATNKIGARGIYCPEKYSTQGALQGFGEGW
jgi:hypothetical protein